MNMEFFKPVEIIIREDQGTKKKIRGDEPKTAIIHGSATRKLLV
jgi:hypothetical protein